MAQIQTARISNAALYSAGKSLLGRAKTIEVPSLKRLTEKYDGLGMLGSLELPVGAFDVLEANITMNTLSKDFLGEVLKVSKSADILVMSPQEVWVSGARVAVEGVEIAMRGFAKETGVGSFEQNKPTEGKYTLSLSYLRISVAGDELVLYDAQNNILVINGEDQNAALRAAMGA